MYSDGVGWFMLLIVVGVWCVLFHNLKRSFRVGTGPATHGWSWYYTYWGQLANMAGVSSRGRDPLYMVTDGSKQDMFNHSGLNLS